MHANGEEGVGIRLGSHLNFKNGTISSVDSMPNIILAAHGDGNVVATRVHMPAMSLYDSHLTSVGANKDLSVQPHGNGHVSIGSKLEVHELQFDGDKVESVEANGNIEFAADSSGKIRLSGLTYIGSLQMSEASIVANQNATEGNLVVKSGSNPSTNIEVPDKNRIVLGEHIEMHGRTVSGRPSHPIVFTDNTSFVGEVELDDLIISDAAISKRSDSGDGHIDIIPGQDGDTVVHGGLRSNHVLFKGNTISSDLTNADIEIQPNGALTTSKASARHAT